MAFQKDAWTTTISILQNATEAEQQLFAATTLKGKVPRPYRILRPIFHDAELTMIRSHMTCRRRCQRAIGLLFVASS
jgi:hypothetical protein